MKTGAASDTSLPCLCPTRLHSSTASSAPRHMPMTCRVSWRAATSWYFCVTASSQSSMRTDSRSSGEAPCPGKVRLYVWMPARFRTLCIEPRSYSVPPNPWIRRAPVPDGASGLLDGIGGLALDLAQPPHAGDDGHAAVEVRQRRAPVADQPPAACRVRHAEQQGRAVLGARAAGCPVHRQARPVFRMRMGGQGFQIGDGAGGQAEGVLQVARQFQFAVIGIEAVHQLVAAGQRQVEAAAPLFRVLKRLGARAAQGVDEQQQQGRDDQVDLGGQQHVPGGVGLDEGAFALGALVQRHQHQGHHCQRAAGRAPDQRDQHREHQRQIGQLEGHDIGQVLDHVAVERHEGRHDHQGVRHRADQQVPHARAARAAGPELCPAGQRRRQDQHARQIRRDPGAQPHQRVRFLRQPQPAAAHQGAAGGARDRARQQRGYEAGALGARRQALHRPRGQQRRQAARQREDEGGGRSSQLRRAVSR
ncbi:hypothetical protein G6F35_010334 [Rhizopus arrhizus]|nr:hypothetical protein G6F35_010334 [Rhizopus arrhizus]